MGRGGARQQAPGPPTAHFSHHLIRVRLPAALAIFLPGSRLLSCRGFHSFRRRVCEPVCWRDMAWDLRASAERARGGAMDTPVVSLVAVDVPAERADEVLYVRRMRTRAYALAGLAIS